MKPILTDFQVIKPPHEKSQKELNEWLTQCHIVAEQFKSKDEKQLKSFFNRYAVKPTQVSKRYFECSDIENSKTWDQKRIYQITAETPQGVDILERNSFFSERALEIMRQFYKDKKIAPLHLIHVTCTGYISPSAAQLLVSEKSWLTDITHAYHMGCYAALPATRIAEAFAKSSDKKMQSIDIVHTEMCGLHMNPLNHTPEQIIVQSLFADGHIKYSVVAEDFKYDVGLRILGFKELIIPDSEHDMTWVPSPWGMQMTLSRDVPDKIGQHLRAFLKSLCPDNMAEVLKNSIFAIHPGGPKIIDAVQKILELSDEQCAESKKILFERGNMSSATLPHIWNEIVKSRPAAGTKVVSLAFGPGLTLFGALFEVA